MGALLNWFLDDSYAEWMIINMYLFWIWSTKHFNMYCALVMGKIPWPSKNLYTMCLRIQRSYFVQSHLIADVIHSWILVDYCSSFLFLFLFSFLPLLPFIFSQDLKVTYMNMWNKAADSRRTMTTSSVCELAGWLAEALWYISLQIVLNFTHFTVPVVFCDITMAVLCLSLSV